MPRLAETIQHSLFSYLWSPIVLFGMLGGVMWASKGKGERADNAIKEASDEPSGSARQ
jgi:formate dehydrogenase iron-sulfur subunit